MCMVRGQWNHRHIQGGLCTMTTYWTTKHTVRVELASVTRRDEGLNYHPRFELLVGIFMDSSSSYSFSPPSNELDDSSCLLRLSSYIIITGTPILWDYDMLRYLEDLHVLSIRYKWPEQKSPCYGAMPFSICRFESTEIGAMSRAPVFMTIMSIKRGHRYFRPTLLS